jgi:hypothetical protein
MDLRALAVETPTEHLPELVVALATAQALALARIAAPATKAVLSEPRLEPLTKAWATAHGFRLETAQKLARAGRLEGARPAPSAGKGKRRRWLVPTELGSV